MKIKVSHVILTTGQPCAAKVRRLSPEKLDIAKKEFDILLSQGICRPSNLEWSSPLQLVKKKTAHGDLAVITVC